MHRGGAYGGFCLPPGQRRGQDEWTPPPGWSTDPGALQR